MPKILMDELQYEMALKNLRTGKQQRDDAVDQRPKINAPSCLLSYMAKDRPLVGGGEGKEQTEDEKDNQTQQFT
jgi:hypothetical protein